MTTTPKWAQDLILNALLFTGCERVPEVTWRKSSHKQSSGREYFKDARIVVTAGKDRTDAKLVTLHELAHFIVDNPTESEHHSKTFWDMAWKLYRWAGLPMRYCQKREYSYKAGAKLAYARQRRDKLQGITDYSGR